MGFGYHHHLLDVAPNVNQEVVTEAAHEVSIALDGLPALQRPGGLVRKDGQIFSVALAGFPPFPWPVHEEQVRVMLPSLQNPFWQRHLHSAEQSNDLAVEQLHVQFSHLCTDTSLIEILNYFQLF